MVNSRKYYQTWAAKPGALEAKARDTREDYRLLRSLNLCARCRKEEVVGQTKCPTCAIIHNEGRVLARNMKRHRAARYSPGFEPCNGNPVVPAINQQSAA